MNEGDRGTHEGAVKRSASPLSRIVPLAVIAASLAFLVLAGRQLTGAGTSGRSRVEAGPEFYSAVRRLELLELVEHDCRMTLSRTVRRPWWDRLPLDELSSEIEIGVEYSVRVTAGIDLSGVPDDFISIEDGVADVVLPAPEVVNTVVSEIGTPWIRTGGIPADWDSEVLDMRADLAAEAKVEAVEDAIGAGILEQAGTVAVEQAEEALKAFGIEEVHVRFE